MKVVVTPARPAAHHIGRPYSTIHRSSVRVHHRRYRRLSIQGPSTYVNPIRIFKKYETLLCLVLFLKILFATGQKGVSRCRYEGTPKQQGLKVVKRFTPIPFYLFPFSNILFLILYV